MKNALSNIVARAVAVLITVFFQIGVLIGLVYLLGDYSEWLLIILPLFSLLCIVYIMIQDTYQENKITWIILMFTVPLVGGLIYVFFSGHRVSKRKKAVYKKIERTLENAMIDNKNQCFELLKDDPQACRQSEYLSKIAYAPAHINTKAWYFKLGEEKLEAMLLELQKAERFIFLEYFIIEEGKMWGEIEKVLISKAESGVDVRVLFDDFGCLTTLPSDFSKRLSNHKIDCRAFNRFNHLFNSNFNNRDHRKICVIDGNTGFTGGINLADEYINHKVKYGHWKDTAVMLKGDAVYNLTVMFLSMWGSVTENIEEFSVYKPTKSYPADGVVQPFSDSPLDKDAVGETIYMTMLNRAENYVYITSPYLIISREMMVSLITSAKSGVDVRILLPGVPDKKLVHFLSCSYYEQLIKAGVKIFEYTPGFIHSKMFISDDKTAVVGTINLDYRSLSLHYECGVWLYRSSVIKDIKADFLLTQNKCHEITLEDIKHKGKFSIIKFITLGILRTFAPLM